MDMRFKDQNGNFDDTKSPSVTFQRNGVVEFKFDNNSKEEIYIEQITMFDIVKAWIKSADPGIISEEQRNELIEILKNKR